MLRVIVSVAIYHMVGACVSWFWFLGLVSRFGFKIMGTG